MEKDAQNTGGYEEMMNIANSPEGQALISLLQNFGGNALPQAMEQAEQGDYTDAKEIISRFLKTAQAQELVEKIRGKS